MPELMKLHDEYHERGLEIIAIHDNSVTSMEELDKQLETTRRDLWNGRSLPFRVAIAGLNPDNPSAAQATVIADYGITQFPTTLLIDRSGKVIRQLNAYQTEENRKLIKGLLE